MRINARTLSVAAGFCIALAAGTAGAAERITIGTNPAGSLYHVIGGGLAKMLNEKLGRPATIQPYAGSSVYLPLIENGEVTLGLSSSLDSGRAFAEGKQKLRALARLWPLSYAYMVRADSGIRSVADLKGKRVVVDIKANASLGAANRAILASGGLSEADVEAVTIGGLPQGSKGVIEGTIDATSIATGIPLTRQAHAAIPGGIRYAGLAGPDATAEFLDGQLKGLYTVALKPSEKRPDVPEEITVAGFDIFLLASAALSAEEAEAIVAALHENFAGLQESYPPLRRGKADLFAAATNTVPYHEGAAAYYRGKGLWSDANEAKEATLAGR